MILKFRALQKKLLNKPWQREIMNPMLFQDLYN